MNEIRIFSNPDFGEVRTLKINGEPWFVGKDVAKALGYGDGKSLANAVAKHIDDEDKGVTEMMTPGGKQPIIIINESGLYSLILSSRLPSAKTFKHWVTSEILPAIRKHGAYMTEQTIEQAIADPDFLIRLATEFKNERAKNSALQNRIETDKPKVLFANAVNASSTSILIGELAKILKQNGVENIGQNRLFAYMREHGYLMKLHRTDYNMPTQKAMNLGLFEIKESVIQHSDGRTTISKIVCVTGKGQIYFMNLFLRNGGEESCN